MLIKTVCTVGGISMNKHQVKMSIVVPAVDLANSVSSLQLIGQSFDIGLSSNGKKYRIKNVILAGIKVDRDGESRIQLEIDPDDMQMSFGELSELKSQNVKVVLKGGSSNGQNDNDKGDNENSQTDE